MTATIPADEIGEPDPWRFGVPSSVGALRS